MNTYLCSYPYNGDKWEFQIMANSFEEAQERLWALRLNSTLDGELHISIPVEEQP